MGISTALLDVCIPSGIFCYRNCKKVENGEKARSTVAFAQGAKIVDAFTRYNDSTIKTTNKALSIFNKYAQKSKLVDYTGKAVNWATHNVNPLICMASGVKVLTSDDKTRTGITEIGALSGMFLGEGLIKHTMPKYINESNIQKLANKFKDTKFLKGIAKAITKPGNSGKAASIIKGLLFVCGSISSYSIGQKIGASYADRICTDLGMESAKKINQEI